MYVKGVVIKHINTQVIGKVDLTDLWENRGCDNGEKGKILI